jgi:hypothetical protein
MCAVKGPCKGDVRANPHRGISHILRYLTIFQNDRESLRVWRFGGGGNINAAAGRGLRIEAVFLSRGLV